MELYNQAASAMSRVMTEYYSSSFGSATRLFTPSMRPHIYNIYGLVRLADEIVDTYIGNDMLELLDGLEAETYTSLSRGYSVNPVVHAFMLSANKYRIGRELIEPFFESMRMDTRQTTYDQKTYEAYIHGSAEVVGLMCLRVFCDGNLEKYEHLKEGAARLGAAYQKVNFLRDLAGDYAELGRLYFPGLAFESISERDKLAIVSDIRSDLDAAREALVQLPGRTRLAVSVSYRYYGTLLDKLEKTPIEIIKRNRIRVSKPHKLALLGETLLKGGL